MTSEPIIVTGGAGFIGSHTCKTLAEAGYLPVTIDNLQTGHADAVRWGPLEQLDLRDTRGVSRVLQHYGAQYVIHFAARAYVGESVQNPDLYYDNNVGGMISLLSAMKAQGVWNLVFSSSCATYGVPLTIPVLEASPQAPINPYGRTKLIGEMMLRDHAAAFGLRSVILRYFNAAGADPSGALGEKHEPETHLIPLALRAASGAHRRLTVFGADYMTPDGTCIRDYIHVSDLARAHLLAVRHLQSGGQDVALNLGSGQGTSIRDILRSVENLTGHPVPHVFAPRRAGDPAALVADITKAKQIIGFRPERSDLVTILKDAAPHFGVEVRNDVHA